MKKINELTIISTRWFDKTYGNTYHSCRVLIDNKEIGVVDFTYGYDEMYIQTALEILKSNDYLFDNVNELKRFISNNKDSAVIYCKDVKRKKDMGKYMENYYGAQ